MHYRKVKTVSCKIQVFSNNLKVVNGVVLKNGKKITEEIKMTNKWHKMIFSLKVMTKKEPCHIKWLFIRKETYLTVTKKISVNYTLLINTNQ